MRNFALWGTSVTGDGAVSVSGNKASLSGTTDSTAFIVRTLPAIPRVTYELRFIAKVLSGEPRVVITPTVTSDTLKWTQIDIGEGEVRSLWSVPPTAVAGDFISFFVGKSVSPSGACSLELYDPEIYILDGVPIDALADLGVSAFGLASAVSGAPSYVGQTAVVAGVGYMATGTASSADWKQITA